MYQKWHGIPLWVSLLYSSSRSVVTLSRSYRVGGGGCALVWRYTFCSAQHAFHVWSATIRDSTPPPPPPSILNRLWRSYLSDAWKSLVGVRCMCWSPVRSGRRTVLWSTKRHVASYIKDSLLYAALLGVVASYQRSWNLMSYSRRAPPIGGEMGQVVRPLWYHQLWRAPPPWRQARTILWLVVIWGSLTPTLRKYF